MYPFGLEKVNQVTWTLLNHAVVFAIISISTDHLHHSLHCYPWIHYHCYDASCHYCHPIVIILFMVMFNDLCVPCTVGDYDSITIAKITIFIAAIVFITVPKTPTLPSLPVSPVLLSPFLLSPSLSSYFNHYCHSSLSTLSLITVLFTVLITAIVIHFPDSTR